MPESPAARVSLLFGLIVLTVVATQLEFNFDKPANVSDSTSGGSPQDEKPPEDDDSFLTRAQRRAKQLWYLYNR